MHTNGKRIAPLLVALGFLGCGGSLKGNPGPDGSTSPGACSSLGACECMAASDRCVSRTEACWCPSECDSNIVCVCGGGRFLGCEDKNIVNVCSDWLAAVQAKCAGQPFVQYIDSICVNTVGDPLCTAGCLANLENTGSCSEIDCSFCPVCDCAPPATRSTFAACLQACRPPPPPEL
jgi:hypothetical protein